MRRAPSPSLGFAVVSLALSACPAPTQELEGEAPRRAALASIVDGVVLPSLADFRAASTTLKTATAAGDVAAARTAWRAAMDAWQVLEVVHVGPAGSPASFTGGLGLRERVYAWPLVNLCAVDQQLLVGAFEETGWVDQRLPNVIGLSAVEYVLFIEGSANACPADAALNTDGSWAALGDAEITSRRARYAAVLAADIERQASSLADAWTSSFAATLKTAGQPGSSFPTAQQALDEVYAALFAVELGTKDKKLAIPAGLHVDCPVVSCPDKAESRFSRTSKENILLNLRATRRVLESFDPLLRARGAGDLATTMTTNLDAAIAAVESFNGTLEDALTSEPARVVALYNTVKAFTDDFKSTFPSALGLRVPDEGAGDND